MNNKAQFTLVCTCEIVMRTGETLDSSLGDRPCSDISKILLCPLHEAAPAMYEALKEWCDYYAAYNPIRDKRIEPFIQLTRKALAQAEGRQG